MMPAEFFGNFVGMGAASENRRPRGTGCGERMRFRAGASGRPGRDIAGALPGTVFRVRRDYGSYL